jgi:rhodanese-related sulfurtransferase
MSTIKKLINKILNFNKQYPELNIDAEKFEILNNEGYKIIDVRTYPEYNSFHIDKSILIDIYSPDFSDKIQQLDKSEKYLVYCRSGKRSLYAVNYMHSFGFPVALNLSGGIIKWIKSGKPVIKNITDT